MLHRLPTDEINVQAQHFNSLTDGTNRNCINQGNNIRGAKREYSSKPLKHSFVKYTLDLNGRYRHIFIP